MERYKNALLLHIMLKLPRKELIKPLVIMGAEAELELSILGHSDLIAPVFDLLKHSHEGNELMIARHTRKKMGLR